MPAAKRGREIANAVEYAAENCGQHRIWNRRIRVQEMRCVKADREHHSAEQNADEIFAPEHSKRRDEQRHIVNKYLRADRQSTRQKIDDHADACEPA